MCQSNIWYPRAPRNERCISFLCGTNPQVSDGSTFEGGKAWIGEFPLLSIGGVFAATAAATAVNRKWIMNILWTCGSSALLWAATSCNNLALASYLRLWRGAVVIFFFHEDESDQVPFLFCILNRNHVVLWWDEVVNPFHNKTKELASTWIAVSQRESSWNSNRIIVQP